MYAFNRGESPAEILESFPFLSSLANVQGAISFYLEHEGAIDQHLEDTWAEFEGRAIPLEQANPIFWEKIQKAKARDS